MNEFFQADFQISNIFYCGVVPMHNWQCMKQNRRMQGLIFQRSGKKRCDFDYPVCKKYIEIQEGDLYYLPKGSDYMVTDIGYGECIAIDFELTDPNLVYPYFVFSPQNVQKYAQKFEQIVTHWEKKEIGYRNRCMAILYQIIADLQAEAKPRYVTSKTAQLAEQGAKRMRALLASSDVTVADIANGLGVSCEYFRKVFASVYHQSPRKYLVALRCERAKELLLCGEYRIAQIAELCGFETPSYFCRVFSEQCGMTPSQYLKKQD